MPREATIKSYHSSPQPHPRIFGRPHRLKPNPVGWREFIEDDFIASAPSSPTPSSSSRYHHNPNRVHGTTTIGHAALTTAATPTSTRLRQRLTQVSRRSRPDLMGSRQSVKDDSFGSLIPSSPPPSSPTPSSRKRPAPLRLRFAKSNDRSQTTSHGSEPSNTPSVPSPISANHPLADWEPPSDPAVRNLTLQEFRALIRASRDIPQPRVDTSRIACEYDIAEMTSSDYPKLNKIRNELLPLAKYCNPFATQRCVERVESQMQALARITDRPMNHPKCKALVHPDYVEWIPPTDISRNWGELEEFLLRHDPEGLHAIHQHFVIRLKEIADQGTLPVKVDRFVHLFEDLSESDLLFTASDEIFAQACQYKINIVKNKK
ncbi:hypothetical protein EV360DRAFT_74849 [Lentinula raphanica]|nr:hypothetical protein EV360DRAFT_74849 [Lentinula raphanica]